MFFRILLTALIVCLHMQQTTAANTFTGVQIAATAAKPETAGAESAKDIIISFKPDDTTTKSVIVTLGADDFTTTTSAADYALWEQSTPGDCPADTSVTTGFVAITSSAGDTSSFSGASGALTFTATAAGVITLKPANNVNFVSQCYLIVVSKAKVKNCKATVPVSVQGYANIDATSSAGTAKAATAYLSKGLCTLCPDVATAKATPTTPTKLVKDTYCFCGNALGTGQKICGATTDQKCTRTAATAATYKAADAYACAAYAAASGTSAVHVAVTSILMALFVRKTLTA